MDEWPGVVVPCPDFIIAIPGFIAMRLPWRLIRSFDSQMLLTRLCGPDARVDRIASHAEVAVILVFAIPRGAKHSAEYSDEATIVIK